MTGKPFNIDEFVVENRASILKGLNTVAEARARRYVQQLQARLERDRQSQKPEKPVDAVGASPEKPGGNPMNESTLEPVVRVVVAVVFFLIGFLMVDRLF